MITGGSYGGHMTLAVATLYNDRIRCSLDVVGMSNLVTFLENTGLPPRPAPRGIRRRARSEDARIPGTHRALNNADKITKPLFVVAGKNDPRVPWTESQQMVAAVRKNGAPVWYLMANDEGHGFAKKKNADFQFYATVLFIQKFLVN